MADNPGVRTLAKKARSDPNLKLGVLLVAICACITRSEASPQKDDPANAAAQAWRVKHEADYRHDFVTIAGLHPLKPGPNAAGSAVSNDIRLPPSAPASIGSFVLQGERVRYHPRAGARVLLRDRPVRTPIDLRDDRDRNTDEPRNRKSTRIVVHVSGANRSIRVRDPDGPLARGFRGFAWFPIEARYRTTGRFIRDPKPQRLKVVNTYGDVDEFTSEGTVEFEMLGQTLRLRPFTTRPGRLYFVFKDASSGAETYETARLLYSDLLQDGTTVLDFNIAYNPPCAFNEYTTCPIPLRENRLPVKVLAGEKAYTK